MDRISHLNNSGFDLIIFGGGSLGAGIARDGAMRGLSVLLIEQKDFGWGTSSRTSKIIHGGIRYLEYGDLGLVFEALRERFILEKIASHLVHPLPFLIPVYKEGPRPLWKIRAGLFIYDVLSLFKNRQRYTVISREETLKRVPALKPEKLLGSGVYYDSQMNDSRVVLENILDAKSYGATVLNYVKLEQFKIEGGVLKGALLKDQLTGQRVEVKGEFFVNATGPWVSQVAELTGEKNPVKVRMTQGTHIIVPQICRDYAIVVSPRDEKRIFFILPWDQHSLIGTTDIDYQGDPGEVRPLKEEIEYLMDETNTFFPEVHLKEKEIISVFSGVRPLLDFPGVDPSSVTRKVKIVESPLRMISIAGGKFTTYRNTAEKVIDRVGKWLGRTDLKSCSTATEPLYGGKFSKGFKNYIEQNVKRWAGAYDLEEASILHLIHQYGSKVNKVFDLIEKDKQLREKISPLFPNIKAEIIYSIEAEMVLSLSDFLRRRTLLALGGLTSENILTEIGVLMGERLGWDQHQIKKEIENYLKEVCKAGT
ncbi:MAG: glycerol-3-phosphate dehydrogenase [Nitrospirae bacterium]|nr:glycerol-3-phosphate dehydrogenase [Nitrospirota bacterium]MBI3351019.1 glycerol-3-phosphate dehydrogenase [Nitrospirota bacterium]